ncbi:hypothetical protein HYE58_04190 [Aggregatibacter actinomycetemcomitans]|nr:YciI family protein [Aggregatibacter actinomycetemcomitans]EHK90874.1 hypothetical protein RHAA1_03726 [Aggregatibacter actinomycetemcomitans RhAA1]KNE77916.1 hypothetical protein RHAA2_03760 [Aggregatibacter actinomycetemcomitans RhAA1]MBN6079102.1 hypothetical protein [Aggregatibacter actinomycetemcomitans]
MYIINITVNPNVSEEKQNELFPIHVEWFKKYFQAGKFLMLGPYIDTDAHSGVIFAETESREALQKILEEDCYYLDFAEYEIREFAPKMIAEDIGKAKFIW